MKDKNFIHIVNSVREHRVFWLASILLITSWCYIFLDFLPNPDGKIGHDYTYFLPRLLAGYYWFSENGFFKIPYFTPAFCGGDLFYTGPQNLYYSLPQLLTFFVNPLSAVSLTFFTFAAIGYFGFYYLLRDTFRCHKLAALLGAALFLFNNFYAYRLVIGHLSFHGFMLIPLITCFLLKRESNANWIRSNHSYSIAPALLISYILYSGGVAILPPVLFAILVLVLIYASIHRLNVLHFKRFLTASVLAIVFSVSKLMTMVYLLENFPRDGYPLPGTDSFITALWIPFKSLFIAAENNTALLTNIRWNFNRHEFEFGITLVPLIVFSLWTILLLTGKITIPRKTISCIPYFVFIIIILAVPVFLNFFTPEWNGFLKKVPMIRSSSSLFRWYLIYIPFLLVLSGLAFNYLDSSKRSTQIIAGLMLAYLVVSNVKTDKTYYYLQEYDPQIVVQNYSFISAENKIPRIRDIGYGYIYEKNKVARGNEIFTKGISKLNCDQPLFGYKHEFLPQKENLEAGPIGKTVNGHYSLRNPACYIYPDSNLCRPGDNFFESQKTELEDFASYKPYGYRLPVQQVLANVLSLSSVVISFFFLIVYNFRRIRR